jgi:outer membrane immunogenic protein
MDRRSVCGFARPAVAALGLSLLSAGARADDLPVPAPLSSLGSLPTPFNWLLPNYKTLAPLSAWNGFYATPLIGYQTAQFRGDGGRYLRNAQGFTFGGEAGYNFQFQNFVVGPAADVSYSLMRADANTWLASITKANIGWVGSARVTAGYTFDRFMVYGTGGLAFAETQIDGLLTSNSQTEPGWTAGAGVQYLWNEHASLHLEYRRLELQNRDFYALPLWQTKVGVAMNIVNAGFYFRF